MARFGAFIGPADTFGVPLAVVKPTDNNVSSARFHPSLLDPNLALNESEMMDMQQEILELMSILHLAQNLPQSKPQMT